MMFFLLLIFFFINFPVAVSTKQLFSQEVVISLVNRKTKQFILECILQDCHYHSSDSDDSSSNSHHYSSESDSDEVRIQSTPSLFNYSETLAKHLFISKNISLCLFDLAAELQSSLAFVSILAISWSVAASTSSCTPPSSSTDTQPNHNTKSYHDHPAHHDHSWSHHQGPTRRQRLNCTDLGRNNRLCLMCEPRFCELIFRWQVSVLVQQPFYVYFLFTPLSMFISFEIAFSYATLHRTTLRMYWYIVI